MNHKAVFHVDKGDVNRTRDLLMNRKIKGLESEPSFDPEKWEFRVPEEEWEAVERELRRAEIPFERKH
jgi:hypothetical protein